MATPASLSPQAQRPRGQSYAACLTRHSHVGVDAHAVGTRLHTNPVNASSMQNDPEGQGETVGPGSHEGPPSGE